MSDTYKEIRIADIDLTDERYQISREKGDIDFLAASIAGTGLLTPPVVRSYQHRYIVVSGFNRIRALGHNKETTVFVIQLDPDTTDCQYFKKSIALRAFKKPLDLYERIISIRRLQKFMELKKISEESHLLFNEKFSFPYCKDLFRISSLPDQGLELLRQNRLSLTIANRISSMESSSVKVFIHIFTAIKASSSIQTEIFRNIMEITARDGILPKDFFSFHDIQNIVRDENNNPSAKAAHLRQYLFEKRFPSLSHANKAFQKKIRSLKLGGNIKWVPPLNFEGVNHSISFTAKNHEAFKKNAQLLMTAGEKEAVIEIFSP